ncbi:hypothetical protein ATK30_7643 [Amycolatopsis echigonensis]|uniref:Lipoprotein n=1 Tax=Amycolatopsis echigonensis TaxID=2576905 RepID=A0A2N3WS58_9PSEU|nr:hypothetical protein [Amycolatopsis niigatensis]PKV96683.1 hypothetical protein ATK30_7643 [Amycolatopsis niigatensis]
MRTSSPLLLCAVTTVAVLSAGCAGNGDAAATSAPTTVTVTVTAEASSSAPPTSEAAQAAGSTGPRGNPVKKVGEVVRFSRSSAAAPTDPSFAVTKIAKQRSKYGSEQAMVVMLHVETGTDSELNNDLSLALGPVVYVTDPDSGESKSPHGAMQLGEMPGTFGRDKKYDFGFEYKLADVYDHGWLTVNSNGGPGAGIDIQYDLR